MAQGWQYKILFKNLPSVSAIAYLDGHLYATQEIAHEKGTILRLSDPEGYKVIKDSLSKPDGMVSMGGHLYVSQEQGLLPVLKLGGDGRSEQLFTPNNAEGIAATADKIFVIEDLFEAGRIIEYDIATRTTRTLITNIVTGEGICAMANDHLFFVQKDTGQLFEWRDGVIRVIADDLYKPAYVHCQPESKTVWITEESTRRGRLLRYRNNTIDVIAKNLGAPQTVIPAQGGGLLLVEQYRARILKFTESRSMTTSDQGSGHH